VDPFEHTQVDKVIKIGEYPVIEVLGRGGMGVVYRALDSKIGREVAIKTLTTTDPGMLARFYDEGKRTGRLKHPNIVIVYEVGDDHGTPYIVMECVDGDPLDKLIKTDAPLTLADRLAIMEQVCDALGYAHRNNVIHRDVKPANIFVQPDGSAKLLDFGIARLEQPDQDMHHTRTGHLIGTVQYMAPERLRNENVDGRSDIFAAGVVLYQLITGQLPFTGSSETVIMQKIAHEPYPPLRSLRPESPASLEAIIERSLAKSLDERYPTAEEMAADLATVITELRQEQILELLPEAQRLFDTQEFARARTVLNQIIKIDPKHTEARKLLSKIQQHATQRQREEKIQQIKQQVEDAIASGHHSQALKLLEDNSDLVASHPELGKLRDKATREKGKQDRINEFLRQVETARRKGDYPSALKILDKALKEDKTNTKLTQLVNSLTREAEQAEKQSQAKALLDSARSEIGLRRYTEAIDLLKQVEQLDPTNPEIPLLKGDANSGVVRAKQREAVARLEEEVNHATSHEDFQICALSIKEAMESMPTESILFRLNAQVEKKLKEHENRILVDETLQTCGTLRSREALELVRKVRKQLPSDERLLSMEGILTERCRQQSVDERRADYLAKAREALQEGQYAEAVSVLELCQAEGIAGNEVLSLLEFARSEEAEHRRQEQFRNNLSNAQMLLGDSAFDDAIAFLEAVIPQNDDAAFHLLLDQATAGRDSLRKQIDAALSSVATLLQNGKHNEAIEFLQSQLPGVLRAARVQVTLTSLIEERQQVLYRMVGRAYAGLETNLRMGESTVRRASIASPDSDFFKAITDAYLVRGRAVADQILSGAIHKSKELARGRDKEAAERLIQSTQSSLGYASPEMQAEWHHAERRLPKGNGTSRRGR